jgi:hypothetical protein
MLQQHHTAMSRAIAVLAGTSSSQVKTKHSSSHSPEVKVVVISTAPPLVAVVVGGIVAWACVHMEKIGLGQLSRQDTLTGPPQQPKPV